MEIIPVTPLLLNSFENYILPSVMNDLREDQENHFAFGLVQNTHSCGAAAGYFYGDRFRIRSFYVDEAICRQGAGSLLLNGVVSALTGYAEQIDINYVLNDSLRAEMESFLDTHGFSAPALVSKIYVIRLGDVQNTRFFRGGSPLDAQRIFPLYHLPDSMLEPLATGGMPEYLSPLIFARDAQRDISLALLDGKSVAAFLVFTDEGDANVSLRAAYSRPDKRGGFLPLIRASVQKLAELYGPELLCRVCVVNQTADDLVEKLTEGRYLRVTPEYSRSLRLPADTDKKAAL